MACQVIGFNEDEEPIFSTIEVDERPELIGGLASVQRLIVYPEQAKQAGIEGRVIVVFVVDKQGQVEDATVSRGLGYGCDEVSLEAVRQAQFVPGRLEGEPVKVRMSLPITFKLK